MSKISDTTAESFKDCQRQCQEISECNFVAFMLSSLRCRLIKEKGASFESQDRISGPKYCSSPGNFFALADEITPKQNYVVHTFKDYGPNYKIKFRVTVKSLDNCGGSGASGPVCSVFGVSSGCPDSERNDCFQPAVLYYTTRKRLNVRSYFDNTNLQVGRYENIKEKVPYDVELEQKDGTFTFSVNSEVIASKKNTKPILFHDMRVYLGLPSLKPIDGTISNLEISSSSLTTTNTAPSSGNFFAFMEPRTPTKGNVIHTFKDYGPDFKIKARITVKSFPKQYACIFAISSGCFYGEVACRQPMVFVYKDKDTPEKNAIQGVISKSELTLLSYKFGQYTSIRTKICSSKVF